MEKKALQPMGLFDAREGPADGTTRPGPVYKVNSNIVAHSLLPIPGVSITRAFQSHALSHYTFEITDEVIKQMEGHNDELLTTPGCKTIGIFFQRKSDNAWKWHTIRSENGVKISDLLECYQYGPLAFKQNEEDQFEVTVDWYEEIGK